MIKFLHPEFLYYMLPPLLVLFWLILTKKENIATFFDEEVMKRLRASSNHMNLKTRNRLFFTASVLFVVALADPVINDKKIKVEQKSSDIFVALDISNSMLATDVYPNRLLFAKKKAKDFIEKLLNDRVSILAFANGSYLVSPLSFDKEALIYLLDNLDTTNITEQGTSFKTLLESVAKAGKEEKKYLVIFSDGGDKEDFSDEIEFAKDNGIVVYVLAVATKKGSPIKLENGEFLTYKGKTVITKLNKNIASLATKTGGVYVSYSISNKDIEILKNEIEKKAKKHKLKDEYVQKYQPLFMFPLGLGMLLVLIGLSSKSSRKKVGVPHIFLIMFLFGYTQNLHATLLDFLDIKKAEKSYEKKDYKNSAEHFEKYAKNNNNEKAYYDAANAYYKAGDYKKAIELYKKSFGKSDTYNAKVLYNLGNAYAKSKHYKKAIKAYKDSLKLKDDKDTKYNLELVKKLLKKKNQKQQQKNNKNKNGKKNKNNKNRQHQKNKQQKQNKNNNNNNKEEKNKNKSKQNKNNQKQNGDKQNKKNQKQNKQHPQNIKKPKMTKDEERKWLNSIKTNKTFMYILKPPKEKTGDEKPW